MTAKNFPKINSIFANGLVRRSSKVPNFISSEKDFIPRAGKRKMSNHGLSSKNRLRSPKPASKIFQAEGFANLGKEIKNKKLLYQS